MAPGGRWSFALRAGRTRDGSGVSDGSDYIRLGARSGAVFSFNSRIYDSKDDDIAICDVNADLMCETLYFGVQNDPEDYRRFKRAFDEGIDFAGLSMPEVAGSPIRVQVYRRCQTEDGSPATDLYSARSGTAATTWPPSEPPAEASPPWTYHIPLVSAASDGAQPASATTSERLYLQNTGWACASVELWARPLGGCGLERRLAGLELAPGEQRSVDAGAIRFPELGDLPAGSLRLSSDQRLALVTESRGADWLASTEILAAAPRAVAPLLHIEPAAGWNTRLHLLNPSAHSAAELRVTVSDLAGGRLVDERVDLCPLGLRVIDLGALPGQTLGAQLGAARVERIDAGADDGFVALAELVRRDGGGRVVEAARYPLEPFASSAELGGGLLSLPILSHAPASGIPPATLALHNANPSAGFTDAAIYLFDRNGFVDLDCQRLGAGATTRLAIPDLAGLSKGFDGHALVSASYWEHPEPDPLGGLERNRALLVASLVERWGAEARPVAGADANAARALALPALPVELAAQLPVCLPDPSGPVPASPAPGQATPRPPAALADQPLRPVLLLDHKIHLPLILQGR